MKIKKRTTLTLPTSNSADVGKSLLFYGPLCHGPNVCVRQAVCVEALTPSEVESEVGLLGGHEV